MIRLAMPASNERSRNNVRAGLFVVVTLLVGLGVFITLQKLSLGEKNRYRLRFRVENGVAGIAPGTDVRVGGLERGRVLEITPVSREGVLDRIEVDFDLDASIQLYENAAAVRVAPILGNTAWINFVSVGGPQDANGDGTPEPMPLLKPGSTFDAVETPGMLANIFGGKGADQIVTIIERTESFSRLLDRAPGDYDEKVVPALEAASATVVRLREDYDRWRASVDDALVSATAAARNLEEGTRRATDLVAEAHDTLTENRPRIASTMTNLESATATAKEAIDDVRTNTLPQVARLLGDGERAMGELADLLDRADGEIASRLPDLRSFLSDARVAAQQLKLATIEVRRSPWRLLYRPSTDVLAHEQLYEATRTFAVATGDLRSAAESVEQLLKSRPDLVERDSELRERLQKRLVDTLGQYEEAQRRLYGVLLGEK